MNARRGRDHRAGWRRRRRGARTLRRTATSGSDTLANTAPRRWRVRSARTRGARARPHQADCGSQRTTPASRGAWGIMDAAIGRQGQHGRPLGDRRAAPRAAVSDVSERVPGGRDRCVLPTPRDGRSSATSWRAEPLSSTQYGAEHMRARRVDRVHVGRFGLSDRRARRGRFRWTSSTRRVTSRVRCWLRRTTFRA